MEIFKFCLHKLFGFVIIQTVKGFAPKSVAKTPASCLLAGVSPSFRRREDVTLRLIALQFTIEPFANVVRNYIYRDGNKQM